MSIDAAFSSMGSALDRMALSEATAANLDDFFRELEELYFQMGWDAETWKIDRVRKSIRVNSGEDLLQHLGASSMEDALNRAWVEVPDSVDEGEAKAALEALVAKKPRKKSTRSKA